MKLGSSSLAALVIVLGQHSIHGQSSAPPPSIPAPDPAAAEVAAGYRVEVAVRDLMYPTSVEFAVDGTMYVAEGGYVPGDDSQPARIYKFSKAKTDLARELVADQLAPPITDLLWHDGKLYVSHKSKISVVESGALRDLVTDLPSLGDHSNNQLAVGLDGKLYFGQGSATNSGVVGADNFAFGWPKAHPEVCETSAKDIVLRGQVFECPDPRGEAAVAPVEAGARSVRTSAYQPFGKTVPEGTVIKGRTKANGTVLRMNPDGTDLEVFAWGFRNPYGVQWSRDGRLYVADAGSDERGSRPIANEPEKLFLAKKDAWYGWPDFLAGLPVTDARYAPKGGPAPAFLLAAHPTAEKPLMTFENHSSITQIAFSPGETFGFDGDLFLGSSGDQSPVTAREVVRAGYWVKRVDAETGTAQTFFRTKPEALGPPGLEYVETAGPKRIVDLRFAPTGDALYLVDIGPIHYVEKPEGPQPQAFPGTGVIWRITRAK